MKLKLILEPFRSVSWPMVKIKLGNTILFNGLCKPNNEKYFHFETTLTDLQPKNILQIEHYDKKGTDSVLDNEGNIISDKAISLKSLQFDGLKVPDVILYASKFYPDWPDQPEYITNNLYFGFNGTYKFEFGQDAKKMYYQHLLQKESIANTNNVQKIQLPSGEEVESFEFNGKLQNGKEKVSVTIEQLYQNVINED